MSSSPIEALKFFFFSSFISQLLELTCDHSYAGHFFFIRSYCNAVISVWRQWRIARTIGGARASLGLSSSRQIEWSCRKRLLSSSRELNFTNPNTMSSWCIWWWFLGGIRYQYYKAVETFILQFSGIIWNKVSRWKFQREDTVEQERYLSFNFWCFSAKRTAFGSFLPSSNFS